MRSISPPKLNLSWRFARSYASLDPQGLGEYVACGCVLENRTLFQGLHILPPGSAWSFRAGAIEEKAAYFEPREWEEQEPLDAETLL